MQADTIRPRRSLIFAPGLKPEMFAKALTSGADIVCLDIEDAVAPAYKAEARAKCLALFADLPDPGTVEPMLRINPMGTEEGMRDVLAILEATRPPPALVMTKAKTAGEVAMLDELLGEKHAHVRLHVIIETNQGLENAYAIGQASGRIDSLLFGGYDMSAELRVEPQWEALLHARARVAHAAAAASVDLIDVPHLDLDDLDGLAIAARKARRIGFTGKAAIHPKQIEIINSTFSPSEEQITEARRVVAAFEEGGASGLLMVDGKLIEAPVLRSMQRTLAVAKRIGAG